MQKLWRNVSSKMSQSIPFARRQLGAALACVALIALPLCARADDTAKGKIIAKRWCASCHVVSSDQTKGNSDAPSFSSIADDKLTPKTLKAFLSYPHPKMPDMNLSRNEIGDLVAYIRTLAR